MINISYTKMIIFLLITMIVYTNIMIKKYSYLAWIDLSIVIWTSNMIFFLLT